MGDATHAASTCPPPDRPVFQRSHPQPRLEARVEPNSGAAETGALYTFDSRTLSTGQVVAPGADRLPPGHCSVRRMRATRASICTS